MRAQIRDLPATEKALAVAGLNNLYHEAKTRLWLCFGLRPAKDVKNDAYVVSINAGLRIDRF